MTAIELKSSIINELNVMNVELLETVARYVRKLNKPATVSVQDITPRKIVISENIKSLQGKFALPADMDAKDMKANYLTEKHVGR